MTPISDIPVDIVATPSVLVDVYAQGPTIQVELNAPSPAVEVTIDKSGPQGVRGVTGPEGPQGIPGTNGGSFEYSTVAPSDTWVITHNLGKNPSVTVVDSANTVVIGNIEYLSDNELVITFAGAFSGSAYLN